MSRRHAVRRRSTGIPMAGVLALGVAAAVAPAPAGASGPAVLTVGRFHGHDGEFSTIQDAVYAAHAGDWILVAPGDYHEHGRADAGVWVEGADKAGLHIRGLDRNGVIIDGTRPTAPAACAGDAAYQDFGVPDGNGGTAGRNGVEVYKTSGVTVENLTVCNFLSSPEGENGNQVWFNGGDGSGVIGLHAWHGGYLTASSTYYDGLDSPRALYGMFAVNADGPGRLDNAYASNMADSGFYFGGCPDCNATLTRSWAQHNALGYSGTNSGGHLRLEHNVFDHNRVGISPTSLNNDDAPSPQDGVCPGQPGVSCTFIVHNVVHDNNNGSAPGVGGAFTGIVGAGIELAGGRTNTVSENLVFNQDGWGIVVLFVPDPEPPGIAACQGGIQFDDGVCFFDALDNRIEHNVLLNNGGFGNPTNGDIAEATGPSESANCWIDNLDATGTLTQTPADLQTHRTCGVPGPGGDTGELVDQLRCSTGNPLFGCTVPDAHYPLPGPVRLIPIRHDRPTMADPCQGLPATDSATVAAWCQH